MAKTQTAQEFTPEERKKYLGASEIATVMGVNPFASPIELYNQKLGLEPPFTGNNHTERGNVLEPVAAEFYENLTEKKLRRNNTEFIHPEYDFIRGHIDRVVQGERTIVEIKCPTARSYFRSKDFGVPEMYLVQLNTYLGLAGFDRGELYFFCADEWDGFLKTVEFRPSLYEKTIQAGADFWNNYILTQTPPPIDPPDIDTEITKLDGEVTHRNDPEFVSALADLAEAEQFKKRGNELYSLAKKSIINLIDDQPGRYSDGSVKISYYEVMGRKTFDKKALIAHHPEIDLERFEKQGRPYKNLRVSIPKQTSKETGV